jgi:23S rRNA pseudouridine2605 synthase
MEKREGIRLNKFIAHSGLCSRRKAADLVKAGKVKVNGEVEENPSYMVQPDDQVIYDEKVLKVEENKVYILLNKPKKVVTTVSDEKGRRTVIDLLGGKVKERVYPVGRLDFMTTGLLVLTNDGDLAKKLSHPSHEVRKLYHVGIDKPITKEDVAKIEKGLLLEDGLAEVDSAKILEGKEGRELMILLHQGKNRIIRRIFEHLGYTVVKLDRVNYAGLTKKDLPRGWNRRLTQQELIMLKHFN